MSYTKKGNHRQLNNEFTHLALALWQSGIAPVLLIWLIFILKRRFTGNKKVSDLLALAESAVHWAEQSSTVGAEKKANALKYIVDYLVTLDKAHLFTSEELNDAIETAVTKMKGMTNE